ncbi:glycosyltransferase family 2 protein, partial [bacterium]|nr:glycosyltransferase family 2 protein [bacterium]
MPAISVVIPVYNKKAFIGRALLSAIRQSFRDIEIIVVDDGSTDQSSDVIKSIRDPRIKLISQNNQGVSAARNRGIAEASGNYVAFLDADDEWLPNYLETIMRMYRKFPDVGACASNYIIKTPDGHLKKANHKYARIPHWDGIIPNYFRVALGPS